MNALPLIAVGAAAVLLSKKKKKTSREPDDAPGSGFPGEDEEDEDGPGTITGWAVTPDLHLTVAKMAYPADVDPTALGEGAIQEQEEDEKKNPPKEPKKKGCKTGTVSSNRREICWGDPSGFKGGIPSRRKMRRVPKYKTARRAAAAVALTGGFLASPLARVAHTRFLLYCWINRKRKGIYSRKCVKRFKRGRKRCRRYRWRRY